jgi:hypothetical protein
MAASGGMELLVTGVVLLSAAEGSSLNSFWILPMGQRRRMLMTWTG